MTGEEQGDSNSGSGSGSASGRLGEWMPAAAEGRGVLSLCLAWMQLV